jgi:hypothetical protein
LSVSVILRALIAVAVCAAVIVLSALADDIFFSDFKHYELVEHRSPTGEPNGAGIVHYYRTPSTFEAVLRITGPLLALVGVAVYVASLRSTRKVRAGAIASVVGAFVALVVIQYFMAPSWRQGYFPHPMNLAIWGAVSAAIGAGSAWVSGVWWPNKSLERTREG